MGLRDRYKKSRVNKGLSIIIGAAKSHIILTVFLLIIVLVGGSFAGYKTTKWMETAEFCAIAICHESMAPYGEAWRPSAHAQQDHGYKCMECHAEVRIGPVDTKYFGTLMSHALDGAPLAVAVVQGKIPHTEFDPYIPNVPSERCLRCHAPDSTREDGFPVTAEDHSSPIDVSEMFEWTIENPRGNKYNCKNCHTAIAHPTDTEILPSERGEKYDNTHPGFPKIDFGPWQQAHYHLLNTDANEKEFVYTGESQGTEFQLTGSEIEINGVQRQLDRDMCLICHKLENLRPENMDGKCQGCHNQGEITMFHHEPILHLPNPNNNFGTTGVVGGPVAGDGGDSGGH